MDQVDSPEIVDDFELGHDEVIDIKDKFVNKQKLLRRISQHKVSCWCTLQEVLAFPSIMVISFYCLIFFHLAIYLNLNSLAKLQGFQ